MRIIAGTFKRRVLKEVPHKGTRSTKDRVKENLFNMLPPLQGATVLDLYAGSGALGLEALSRGADNAFFCEKDKTAFSVLSDNVDALALNPRATLEKGDALSLLRRLNAPFDIILLDPPYNQSLSDKSLEIINERHLLNPGGVIAILHASSEKITIPSTLETVKTRTYGITGLTFLEWSD